MDRIDLKLNAKVIRQALLAAVSLFFSGWPLLAQNPCQPGVVSVASAADCLPPYTSHERLKDYLNRIAGPRPLLASAVGAGIQQARNAPSAWEQGLEGYGRRYGSSMAKRGISNTVQLGVEALLKEDSRYSHSQRSGFWPRLKDAVAHSLVVRTTDGGREIAVGRIAGTMAGGMLSRRWQPEGHRSIRDGLQSGGISFGGYVAGNIFREFGRAITKHLPFEVDSLSSSGDDSSALNCIYFYTGLQSLHARQAAYCRP